MVANDLHWMHACMNVTLARYNGDVWKENEMYMYTSCHIRSTKLKNTLKTNVMKGRLFSSIFEFGKVLLEGVTTRGTQSNQQHTLPITRKAKVWPT